MTKVRWTTICTHCRTPLPAGTHAHHLHHTWWCGPCATRHYRHCTAHQP
jgi:hypothetical protein